MRLSYEPPTRNERTEHISDELLNILVNRCESYVEAQDVLTLAQEKMFRSTKPVLSPSMLLQCDDTERA